MPTLDIPLISQWGILSDERFRNDCGPACVAMVLEYYGKRHGLTADQLAAETPLRQSDTGLFPISLVALLAKHGVAAEIVTPTTPDRLRQEIDAGRPVIVLIHYGDILGRLDRQDTSGHYVLVVGYDDTHFVLDDPDYWVPYRDRGHNYYAPVTELDRAMAAYGRQAIVTESPVTFKDQMLSFLTQADNFIQQAKTLLDQVQPVPSPDASGTAQNNAPGPVGNDLPGSPVSHVLREAMHARSAPLMADSTIVDTIPAGATVLTQGELQDPSNSHTWTAVRAINGVPKTYAVNGKEFYGLIAADVAFPK